MTKCEIKERIKAFAFGFSAEQVAEEDGITVQEAEQFRREHEAEIRARAGEVNDCWQGMVKI